MRIHLEEHWLEGLGMIIFRTSEDTILQVLAHRKYGVMHPPNDLKRGDVILLSVVGDPRIRFSMEFVGVRRDLKGEESTGIWKRAFPWIVDCENGLAIKTPFLMREHAVSGHGYGPGGPSVYVQPEDEEVIRKGGLLEGIPLADHFRSLT